MTHQRQERQSDAFAALRLNPPHSHWESLDSQNWEHQLLLAWRMPPLPLNPHKVLRSAFIPLPLNSRLPAILQTKLHPKAAEQQLSQFYLSSTLTFPPAAPSPNQTPLGCCRKDLFPLINYRKDNWGGKKNQINKPLLGAPDSRGAGGADPGDVWAHPERGSGAAIAPQELLSNGKIPAHHREPASHPRCQGQGAWPEPPRSQQGSSAGTLALRQRLGEV